jgi:hypothetical protein
MVVRLPAEAVSDDAIFKRLAKILGRRTTEGAEDKEAKAEKRDLLKNFPTPLSSLW